MEIINGKYNKAIIYQDSIDSTAYSQIQNLVNQKFTEGEKIRIMPDVHAGKSAVIGYTQTITNGKIVPSTIGVDIGCGVKVMDLGDDPINLEKLDDFIYENIPYGRDIYNSGKACFGDRLRDLRCWDAIKDSEDRFLRAIGTLGGGNHFIELDMDPETENYYLLIHTGSRNLGKRVAEYYQKKAIEYHNRNAWQTIAENIVEECKKEGKEKLIQHRLEYAKSQFVSIPKEFAYLVGQDMNDYLHDMQICTEYANLNRDIIAARIRKHIILQREEAQGIKTIDSWDSWDMYNYPTFTTLHNYIDIDNGIIRKGSVSAKRGEILVIPINMKDGALLCIGKGNPDYNYSAPHGAGRLLSRSEAKELISVEEMEESMKGIYSTCINESTVDESCFAYRNIDQILPHIEPTCEVWKRIYPVYNFKASE